MSKSSPTKALSIDKGSNFYRLHFSTLDKNDSIKKSGKIVETRKSKIEAKILKSQSNIIKDAKKSKEGKELLVD